MARLHDHGRQRPDPREQEQPGVTLDRKRGQVETVLEGFEAFLHVVNAEEQEPEPGEHRADTLQVFRFLEGQHDAEHQHRHCVGRYFYLETEGRHQPGAGSGADVGAENNPDAGHQGNHAGADEGYGDD